MSMALNVVPAPLSHQCRRVPGRAARLQAPALKGSRAISRRSVAVSAKIGVFYSTSTGNTEEIAEWFSDENDCEAAQDIGDIELSTLSEYDGFIIGAPTWHTGADVARSGTAWDDVLDEIAALDLSGKKAAIFGLGDSGAYGDYFCDSMEELYQTFKSAGCEIVGQTPTDGYTFTASKSVIDGKFIGCPFDSDNEADMSEERYAAFITTLKADGLIPA